MKNSKLRRALLLVASAVLLVSISVSATLAYLTSKTEVVTNTFTVGNVTITLDEKDIDNSKTDVTTEGRDIKNVYQLLPNKQYEKDPTVWVDAKSEPCYIFVKVVNGIVNLEKEGDTTIAKQMEAKGWVNYVHTNANGETEYNVWCYCKDGTPAAVKGGESVKVFETFTIREEAHSDPDDTENVKWYIDAYLKNSSIDITAYAIQAEGWKNPTAAELWAAGGFN